MSRRTGVSDWHGGHHEAKKLTQTAFALRAGRLIGLPSRSLNGVFVPSAAVRASAGGTSPGRRPWAGAGPRMYGVAAALSGDVTGFVPSGVVTIARPMPAATTRIAARASWRPVNGPISPCFSRLWVKAGRCAAAGTSDTCEVEPCGQEPEPVEDHRQPDRDDEQSTDDGDGPAVPDQRPQDRRRPVEQHRDQEERDAEPQRVRDQQDAA